MVITAEVGEQILSYNIINSGEIRDYNTTRYPIFYLIMFVTFALFISFVIFMALRRPKGESGYMRGASAVSQHDLN